MLKVRNRKIIERTKMKSRWWILMEEMMIGMMLSSVKLIVTFLKVMWSIIRVLSKITVGVMRPKWGKSKNKATRTTMCSLVRIPWRRNKVQDCSHGWMITRDLITDDLDSLLKIIKLIIIKFNRKLWIKFQNWKETYLNESTRRC